MIQPDAIPVVPLKSTATLTERDAQTLFGDTPGKNANVQIVGSGNMLATIPAARGETTQVTWSRLEHPERSTGLRLVGPVGSCPLKNSSFIENRLVAPSRLAQAWNLPEQATLIIGEIALSVPVTDGDSVCCEVDEALHRAAERPEHARWVPGLTLSSASEKNRSEDTNTPHRIITENDIRQARLRRRKIAVRPEQVVTPAARALGNEWNIFE